MRITLPVSRQSEPTVGQREDGVWAKKGAATMLRPKSREETPEKGMQQAGKRCCDAQCIPEHGAAQEEFCEKILMGQVIVFVHLSKNYGSVAVLQQV
ncbi:MAG: hypothetical protein KA106_03260 [Ferrovibrio sp.]|nr:hypothetical protein [Ferrovibrio sp.]